MEHHSQYKYAGKDSESLHKNRVDQIVSIRKEKRDDIMTKRRSIQDERNYENNSADQIKDASTFADASMQHIIGCAQSSDPNLQLSAIAYIRSVLSGSNPPIDDFIAAGILPILISCLQKQSPEIQVEAAGCFANIVSWSSDQIYAVTDAGAVPHLIQLLDSAGANLCKQVMWSLGYIVDCGSCQRDYCIELGVVQSVIKFVAPSTPVDVLRTVTWVLTNLCHCQKPPLPLSFVQVLMPVFSILIHHTDASIIADTIWALSYLADGSDEQIVQIMIDSNVIPYLASIFCSDDIGILTSTLRAVGNMVIRAEKLTQIIIDHGALTHLSRLLFHTNKKITSETAWLVSNIAAGNKDQIQAVFDANLVPIIIRLLHDADHQTQLEAAWTLSNLAVGGDEKHVQLLVEGGVVVPLCSLLDIQNSCIVLVVLDCLIAVLKKSVGFPYTQNVCKSIEECGGLDKIDRLLNHHNESIYESALYIYDNYFSSENDEEW